VSKAFLAMLVALGLMTLGLHQSRKTARAVAVREPAPAAAVKESGTPPAPVFSKAVEGDWKGNLYDAQQDALRAAQAEVIAYLRNQRPPIDWEPPLDYIETHLAPRPWTEKTQDVKDANGVVAGQAYQVGLEVKISPEKRAYMAAQGRELRMQQRMLALGKGLAVLVVVLAAFAGFLRLDEKTKGFYTGWLKFAAVGVVVGVAAAVLFFWA
jgi:hypothetical protein